MNITKKITFGATAAAALSSALRGRLWRRTIRATARRGRTHTTRIPRPPPRASHLMSRCSTVTTSRSWPTPSTAESAPGTLSSIERR